MGLPGSGIPGYILPLRPGDIYPLSFFGVSAVLLEGVFW